MTEPLTVAEAVPLGTVYLHRLLDDAGIRCLVIKGPAFVELGVRAPRHSNDIDLLIHPDDRTAATKALASAGWSIISYWFPPALDDIIYSTTFWHPRFPVTLDLHHRFSGLLAEPAPAFEVLWQRRTAVEVANQEVTTVGREYALIIEALNATKLLPHDRRLIAAERVVAAAVHEDLVAVTSAAYSVGARHTASPLIKALGGSEPAEPPPPGYGRWLVRGDQNRSRDLLLQLVRRAPMHVPRVVYQQLTLDSEIARFWAGAHSVEYRSRWQILRLRVGRLLRR